MSQSMSQLSISQENPKKKRKSNNIEPGGQMAEAINVIGQKKEDHRQKRPVNHLSEFVPQYLNVSNRKFKQLLLSHVKDKRDIISSLNTREKLGFVRQITCTVNTSKYVLLQEDLWGAYYEYGTKDGSWPQRLSKKIADEYYTCQMFGPPQHFVEQRRKTIECQKQRLMKELQQYGLQLASWSHQVQPPIDAQVLFEAIGKCVEQGQKRLRNEFAYKKRMLQCNYDDHHAIGQFYLSSPDSDQVCIEKRMTVKYERFIID